MLSPAERKTGWMLAEQAGLGRACRIQSLPGRSPWSADALRDRVRDYLAQAGSDFQLRRSLEERSQPYVLAVRSNQAVRFLDGWVPVQTDPAAMAAAIEVEDWRTWSAGEGAKGPRLYHGARAPLTGTTGEGVERWLLIRRSRRDPEELAHNFAYAPQGTSLAELAGAAGRRWTIEQAFRRAKDDLGPDHCEARSWHGWHRHLTLVMAAAARLAKLGADQRRSAFGKEDKTGPPAQAAEPLLPPISSPLPSCATFSPDGSSRFAVTQPVWAWSRWRCQHQARAAAALRSSRGHMQPQ